MFPTIETGRRRPLIRLTVRLIDIYREICRTEDFAQYRQRAKSYICRIGEVLNNGRFSVMAHVGRGAFGQVDKAQDLERPKGSPPVAIKIYDCSFQAQANVELNILRDLRAKDPLDQYNIVMLYDVFEHLGHLCLVLEYLSMNFYQYLKKTRHPNNINRDEGFYGVSLNLTKLFAKQLLSTLDFFSRSDVRVIHCDLKPENILLCDSRHSRIKVIDFGSSCKENQVVHGIVQSPFYRAPEVLLGIVPFSLPIDMWSLGCILFEIHTGETLFEGRRDDEQLFLISHLLGMVPDNMIDDQRATFRDTYFEAADNGWKLRSPTTIFGQQSGRYGRSLVSRIRIKTATESLATYQLFEDLLQKMLAVDPTKRITPSAALNHPIFNNTTAQGEQKELI